MRSAQILGLFLGTAGLAERAFRREAETPDPQIGAGKREFRQLGLPNPAKRAAEAL
jgi:hypothetical protein